MSDNIFKEAPQMNYVEPVPLNDGEGVEAFKQIVKTRRSVRIFTEEQIPEDIVQECLDLALLAPNSSNLQPWQFVRVKSPEKKKELASYCLGQPAATTAAELIVCVARTGTWKENCQRMLEELKKSEHKVPKSAWLYYQKLAPFMYNQGPFSILGYAKKLMLTLVGIFKIVPREPLSQSDMKVWANKSTALACENLMLSFRAFGYDTCPMEGMDAKRIKKLLGLGRKDYVCMVIGAGKRDEKAIYGPQVRFDRDLFIKEV